MRAIKAYLDSSCEYKIHGIQTEIEDIFFKNILTKFMLLKDKEYNTNFTR
jgi:hypothetical protein